MTMTEDFYVEAGLESGDDPILCLAEITHSTLDTPIYCVLNTQDVVSNDITYTAYPFDFSPPKFTKDGLDPGKLEIENVSGTIVEALRTAAGSEPPECTFKFVLASDLDTVQREWPSLLMTNCTYDDKISGTLQFPVLSDEPATKYTATDAYFPGIL